MRPCQARKIEVLEGVSTIPDECKGVGLEISAGSKRKTAKAEDMVSAVGNNRYSTCRTANGYDVNWKESWKEAVQEAIQTGNIKHEILESPRQKDGRGNICPVTIILPTLAMMAREKANKNNTDVVEEFMKILDKKINEAKDMLLERFDWICSQPMNSAKFMYENETMFGYKPEEGIVSAMKHGTLAIGQIGIAETLEILIGCNQTTKKGMELAKRIESMYKDKCLKFKEQYKRNMGCYYTPSENLCFTSMKRFRTAYEKHIIESGMKADFLNNKFFTNSMHVPVWEKVTPFEKIDIESELTGYSSAGCITYVEMDNSCQKNLKALEDVVNYAMDKDIPYFAINVKIDTCMNCGYQGEIDDKCPKCSSDDIQRLRRVTGYLSSERSSMNIGKQDEEIKRYRGTSVEV